MYQEGQSGNKTLRGSFELSTIEPQQSTKTGNKMNREGREEICNALPGSFYLPNHHWISGSQPPRGLWRVSGGLERLRGKCSNLTRHSSLFISVTDSEDFQDSNTIIRCLKIANIFSSLKICSKKLIKGTALDQVRTTALDGS